METRPSIITDLRQLTKPLKNPVLTIGNFDGVHHGHLSLFNLVRERAEALSGESAVMTFDPHPLEIMRPGKSPLLITPTREKLRLIRRAGMDVIFCLPFSREFAAVSASEFVERELLKTIGIRELVVGYDYSFGHQREGNISLLQELGKEHGFRVHVVKPVFVGDTLVSSTTIRERVQAGDLAGAKLLLGREYQICGEVVAGKNRGGRLLGFPTANLVVLDELLPKRGVYAVTVRVGGETRLGVTNIGYNPTFGDTALTVETHLLDFSGDLRGKRIKVNFVQRLRGEETYTSIEDLAAQIQRDVEQARTILQRSMTAGDGEEGRRGAVGDNGNLSPQRR